MDKKNVLFALGTVMLLIVCCTAAGCVGGNSQAQTDEAADPIVGTYVTTFSTGSKEIFDFHADGTMDMIEINSDSTKMIKVSYTWKKTNDNIYEAEYNSGSVKIPMSTKFAVSEDKSSLIYIKEDGSTGKIAKAYNYVIPTVENCEVL